MDKGYNGAHVTFGPGAEVLHFTTTLELTRLHICNLPPAFTSASLDALIEPVKGILHSKLSETPKAAQLDFKHAAQAEEAFLELMSGPVTELDNVSLFLEQPRQLVSGGLKPAAVKLSWKVPQCFAFAKYISPETARTMCATLNGTQLRSATINVTMAPTPRPATNASVMIKNLPMDAMDEEVRIWATALKANVCRPAYQEEEVTTMIKDLVTGVGAIQSFKLLPRPHNAPLQNCIVFFDDPDLTEGAVRKLNDRALPFDHKLSGKLQAVQSWSARFFITKVHHRAIERNLHHLQRQIQTRKLRLQITISPAERTPALHSLERTPETLLLPEDYF